MLARKRKRSTDTAKQVSLCTSDEDSQESVHEEMNVAECDDDETTADDDAFIDDRDSDASMSRDGD